METYYSKKELIKAKNDDTNYIYDLTDLEEFLEYVPTADVVPRDEVEMHGQSYYFKLEQAIESAGRFMAEHDAALAKKFFEEIESVLFTVANPCPSADGTIIVKHSKDFHIRREDYYTIKEKYTKSGEQK